ncbi:hypothetical protein FGO68_gene1922 [Halteria grandinella]|uniref:Uncharacterized protein n=1 Tax=Halteria grandinella TaxID=5974 RepID=A0A8J8NH46_HALGN|nr:hypothetical protein FGO68_gene1922 [Halteria grandinella]
MATQKSQYPFIFEDIESSLKNGFIVRNHLHSYFDCASLIYYITRKDVHQEQKQHHQQNLQTSLKENLSIDS